MRLGEYDTSKTLDCLEPDDCADPVVNMGIDEVFSHEKYDEKAKNRINDIGLVRLWADVTFSSFIKPICLPSTLGMSRSFSNTELQSAGWGRTLTGQYLNGYLYIQNNHGTGSISIL